MESNVIKLSYGGLVCNAIYTYLERLKLRYYVGTCTRQKSVTVSMKTVAVPNIDVKVWTQKNEVLQGN